MAQELLQPQEYIEHASIIPMEESLPDQEALEVKRAFDEIVNQIDVAIPAETKENLQKIQASKRSGYGDVMYRGIQAV